MEKLNIQWKRITSSDLNQQLIKNWNLSKEVSEINQVRQKQRDLMKMDIPYWNYWEGIELKIS